MKKMININFQGRIIPIEETSFEILKQYIESLRAYFAHEEGRDEIISDIESRIAELFSERLKHTVCITDDDVNTVIAGIGRPEDFEEADPANTYAASGNTGQPGTDSRKEPARKSLSRATNDSIIGGVCGGLASYLNIDPSILRVIFVVLTFGSFGTGVLLYILLWAILPARELPASTPKRLYRSTNNRTIGGVAGGLAAYFNLEAWIMRLIFCAPLVLGILVSAFKGSRGFYIGLPPGSEFFMGLFGTFFIIYLILWMILPEAVSTTEKLQMKGEKVNLQSIKNAVKEDPAPSLQRKNNRLMRAIGILFKAFFLCLGGLIALFLLATLIAILFGWLVGGVNLFSVKSFFIENAWQEFLAWGTFILFLGVPAIALLTFLIRRIFGIRSKRHYLAYVFGTLWLAGLFCAISLAVLTLKNFRTEEALEENVQLAAPSGGKLLVNIQRKGWEAVKNRADWHSGDDFPFYRLNNDSLFLRNIRIWITKSEDTAFHTHYVSFARGADRTAAVTRASHIHYKGLQSDSVLALPEGFMISNQDKFRNQQVLVIIGVPIGKKIEINRKVNNGDRLFLETGGRGRYGWEWSSDDGYDEWYNTYRWKPGREYIMTETGLKSEDNRN